MMLKEKSNPWARLKYLYVLPLAAIAVTAFARPEVSEKAEEISAVKVNDLTSFMQENILQDTVKVSQSRKNISIEVSGVKAKDVEEEKIIFEVVEQMPQYPGGMDALRRYLADKIDGSDLKGKAGGRVIVGFTVTKTGKVADVQVLDSDQPVLNEEAENIVRGMSDWIPGKQRNRAVSATYSIPIKFGNVRFAENKQPMILADGKEISMDDLEKMDQIESISVLKDSASIRIYGQRGANGVMLVSTKKTGTMRGEGMKISTKNSTVSTDVVPDFSVTGTVVDEQGRPKAGVSVIIPNTTHGTFTDIDGHFKMKALKGGDLWFSYIGYKSVKTAVASTMTIRMEQEVIRLFPELAGTIKNTSSTSGIGVTNGINVYGIKEGEQPLVIIDGKESMQKDALSKISPDCIKSISVLKDKSAVEVYGEKGKNGVILVTLLSDAKYQMKKNQKKDNAWQMVQDSNADLNSSKAKSFFVDGKATTENDLKNMKASDVYSINTDKNENSVKIYSYSAAKSAMKVKGTVKGAGGKPIAGATVSIQGTPIGTTTDKAGKFELQEVMKGAILVISFEDMNVKVKAIPDLKIVMKKNKDQAIHFTLSKSN